MQWAIVYRKVPIAGKDGWPVAHRPSRVSTGAIWGADLIQAKLVTSAQLRGEIRKCDNCERRHGERRDEARRAGEQHRRHMEAISGLYNAGPVGNGKRQ